MFRKRFTAAAGAVALLGGLGVSALASAGAASAATGYGPYSTSITNRDDSGNNPNNGNNWAIDTFTRTTTLTDNGVDGSNKTLEDWTLVIADAGSFVTDANASNPNGAQPSDFMDSTNGSFSGGMTIKFNTKAGVTPTGTPPSNIDGDAHSTSKWPDLFFGAGNWGNPSSVWGWTYNDSKTCEQWVDSSTNGAGGLPGDGGISGDGMCALSVGPVATQMATVGQPFSFQVPAATGSSAGGIKFSFVGLNHDGLSGDASGKITGTPVTTDVLSVTATVTDAVGDNCPQAKEPQPTVELAAFNTVVLDTDDNGSCSVTFDINVVAPKPAPTPTPTVTPPPTTTNNSGVPSGGVQTGGGLPVQHSNDGWLFLLIIPLAAFLGWGYNAKIRARRSGDTGA